jgi:hypothetical protein
MHNLHLLTSWPCELISTVITVAAVEEVVTDTDEMT